uniref:Uncharacterized protein n=1 Tax=Cacopsylla melanoneura TaxID=428564 RepID=A0A8D9F884_9HEMI
MDRIGLDRVIRFPIFCIFRSDPTIFWEKLIRSHLINRIVLSCHLPIYLWEKRIAGKNPNGREQMKASGKAMKIPPMRENLKGFFLSRARFVFFGGTPSI